MHLAPKAKLVFELSPKSMSDWRALTLRAVSWKATVWLPRKKVRGITKFKQATVTLDFGSRKWEGQVQFLAARASVVPKPHGTDLIQALTESALARRDGTSKLVPRYLYFGDLF